MTPAREVEGIVILGAPRSGTTLLRRLLDAHPALAAQGETGVLRAAARFLDKEVTGAGVELGVRAGLRHAGVEDSLVIERLRSLAFGLLREAASRKGKPRWVEKNAFDAFHIPNVSAVCGGHVLYICLVRHGLDAAVSMLELCHASGSYLLDLHEYIRRHKRPLEGLTHAWVDVNRDIIELIAREPERTLLVKYESLAADPLGELTRILGFLGEELPEGLIDRALGTAGSVGLGDWKTYARVAIDSSSVGRFKGLTPEMLKVMAEIANPMLKELGYEEASTLVVDDPEVARRRYELGLLLNRAKAQGSR